MSVSVTCPRRILVVSPVPTHPADAGNRARVAALLDRLEGMNHLIHFAHVRMEEGDTGAMRSRWGNRYHSIPYRRPKKSFGRKIVDRTRQLFQPETAHMWHIDDWYDPSIEEPVLSLHAKHRFETVIVEYVFLSRLLKRFDDSVLKVIDTHDIFTDRHKLYLENGQRPPWFSTSRAQEAKGLARADIIIAIQEEERQKLERISGQRVVTIGHPVELASPQTRQQADTLLYIGSDNPINLSSIKHFIDHCFPAIQRERPDVQLWIAGSICRKLDLQQKNVQKLGRVDDLTSLYSRADIVINPMRYGTGLKIKSMEALGQAKPLLTSPAGAAGMVAGEGKAFLVADSDDQWIRQSLRLLQDEPLRKRLAREAAAFAREWNRDIDRRLSQIMEGRATVEQEKALSPELGNHAGMKNNQGM